MVRRHGPILRTACAASVTFFAFASLRFDELTLPLSALSPLGFLAGILYTNLFEHWVHRGPMHRGLPLLRNVRLNHIEHHRIFHGANFRTRNPAELAHISGRFWIFPVLFAGHFVVVTSLLPLEAALAFLLACYLHYLAFELSHWLTHVEDNVVDSALARIPVVSSIRAYQIEHHRMHHETPTVAFNFNPPYLGDTLFLRPLRHRRPPRESPAPVLARRRLLVRPVFLLGTALVLGAVALGLAAHHNRPRAKT